jgi:hypothetical protein
MEWTEACSYRNIKSLLEQGKHEELKTLFAKGEYEGKPIRPTRLPMGRFEWKLKSGFVRKRACLDMRHGEALMLVSNGIR